MKLRGRVVLLGGCVLAALGCAGGELEVGFYFLKDSALELRDALKVELNSLTLADEPWIAGTEMEIYDSSAKCLYLKKPLGKADRASVFGKPFVLVAGGKRRLVCAIWPMGSSITPEPGVPVVSSPGFSGPANTLIFSAVNIEERVPRAPQRPSFEPIFAEVFKARGVYHAGIAFTLDQVTVATPARGALQHRAPDHA